MIELDVTLVTGSPVRVTQTMMDDAKWLREFESHVWRYETDDEYRRECDERAAKAEADRRASLTSWQRWREDHPRRWGLRSPLYRLDDSESDDYCFCGG